jgi:hypothetical protein
MQRTPSLSKPGSKVLNALLKEIPLAIQGLEYASICLTENKLHTQLSIISVWPCLIRHIWRAVYPARDFVWNPKNSIEEQEAPWETATYMTSIRSLLEEYYKTLHTKTIVLPFKVHNGLHDNKERFKTYLTNLLNIWEVLARLAIYDSIIAWNTPLPSSCRQEDLTFFDAWDNMDDHIRVWNVKNKKQSGSLKIFEKYARSGKGTMLQHPPPGRLLPFQ